MDSADGFSSIPPAQPGQNSRRDASRTTEGPKQAEWEAHKEQIRLLYQQYPLKKVKQILEDRGFVATQRMFKSRLAQWGFVKNSSDREYQVAVLLLQDRRAAGKHNTVFVINGHTRTVKDLRKYIKGRKMSDEQFTRLARQNEVAGELQGVHIHVRCGTPDPEGSETEINQSPTSVSSLAESPPSSEPYPLAVDGNGRASSVISVQIAHRTSDPHRSRRNSIKIRKNRVRISSISKSGAGLQPQTESSEKIATPGSMYEPGQAVHTPRHSPSSCDHYGIEDVGRLACSAIHSNPLPGTFGVDNQDALKLLNPPHSRTHSGTSLTCENCSPPAATHFANPQYDYTPSISGSRPLSLHPSPRDILNPSDSAPLDAFRVAPSSKDHDHCSRWASLCFLTCIYSTKHETSPDDVQADTLAQKSLVDADREFEAILRSDDSMIVLALNSTLTILHQHNQKDICEKIMKSTAAVAERLVGVYSPIGILTRYLGYAANPEKLLQQGEITSQRLRHVWSELAHQYPDGERDKRSIGALYCLGHLLNTEGYKQHSQSKFRESASVLQQCYRLSREVLGPHALQSVMALAGLRFSLEQQGDVLAAIGYAELAINDSLLCLGTQHPKRLELMRNLAVSYFQVGRNAEAEKLCWKVLEGRVNMLGASHEYTEAIAYDLQEYLERQNRWLDATGEPTPEHSRLEGFFSWDVVDHESADEDCASSPLKEAYQKLKAY